MFFFFFQAEDGIRDRNVTGVQTCALPICSKIKLVLTRHEQAAGFMAATYGRLTGRAGVCLTTLGPGALNLTTAAAYAHRSEERRVGKECRARWAPCRDRRQEEKEQSVSYW